MDPSSSLIKTGTELCEENTYVLTIFIFCF